MLNAKCPGQDRTIWKPDDIYDVICTHCGRTVEFFKTDTYRLCPGCGARLTNPQLALGCAQWCEHAIACLGYDPNPPNARPEHKNPANARIVQRLEALRKSLSPPHNHDP